MIISNHKATPSYFALSLILWQDVEGIAKIINGKICREDNIQTLFGDLVLNENTHTIFKLGKITFIIMESLVKIFNHATQK